MLKIIHSVIEHNLCQYFPIPRFSFHSAPCSLLYAQDFQWKKSFWNYYVSRTIPLCIGMCTPMKISIESRQGNIPWGCCKQPDENEKNELRSSAHTVHTLNYWPSLQLWEAPVWFTLTCQFFFCCLQIGFHSHETFVQCEVINLSSCSLLGYRSLKSYVSTNFSHFP